MTVMPSPEALGQAKVCGGRWCLQMAGKRYVDGVGDGDRVSADFWDPFNGAGRERCLDGPARKISTVAEASTRTGVKRRPGVAPHRAGMPPEYQGQPPRLNSTVHPRNGPTHRGYGVSGQGNMPHG